MIKQHGVYSEPNRRKNMSYKDYLKQKITELEQTISKTSEEKEKVKRSPKIVENQYIA